MQTERRTTKRVHRWVTTQVYMWSAWLTSDFIAVTKCFGGEDWWTCMANTIRAKRLSLTSGHVNRTTRRHSPVSAVKVSNVIHWPCLDHFLYGRRLHQISDPPVRAAVTQECSGYNSAVRFWSRVWCGDCNDLANTFPVSIHMTRYVMVSARNCKTSKRMFRSRRVGRWQKQFIPSAVSTWVQAHEI